MWHFIVDSLYMIVHQVRDWMVTVVALLIVLGIVIVILAYTGFDIRELMENR